MTLIVVATTRPETMLGDTAVAVHAKDERYLEFHGKEVELPLSGRRIPIVPIDIIRDGKPWPDVSFGSGAVKVTPAHDPNDYEVSQIAKLPVLEIIDKTGRMKAPVPAKYVGMTVDEARKAVVADLEAAELLVETKPYKVPRGRSQRSGAVIEPMLMEQWWVNAKPLAGKAIAAVEQGKTKFVPEHHTKTFMHWDDEHPGLVHLASAVVGPSDPRVLLRQRPYHRRARCAERVQDMSEQGADPGSGHPRHLVQLWPVAVLDAGLARADQGARDVLSEQRARHGARHHLLLDRPHDDDGPALHEEGAVPDGLPDVDGHRRQRQEDVEDQG